MVMIYVKMTQMERRDTTSCRIARRPYGQYHSNAYEHLIYQQLNMKKGLFCAKEKKKTRGYHLCTLFSSSACTRPIES